MNLKLQWLMFYNIYIFLIFKIASILFFLKYPKNSQGIQKPCA